MVRDQKELFLLSELLGSQVRFGHKGLLFDDLGALVIEKAMVTLRAHEFDQAVAELDIAVELFPALGAGNPKDIFTNRHA